MIYTKSFTLELLAEMKYFNKPITEAGLSRDRPRLYNAIKCYFESLEAAISKVTPIPVRTYNWTTKEELR
ncbi:hypothetical protein CON53_09195 [Bacillus cereus]|nr:hypothetical protein CON53_09195 [Bacillus cereus]